MIMNVEAKLRFLEDQIVELHKENEAVAKILVEKIKPMVDEYESRKAEEQKESVRVLYG